ITEVEYSAAVRRLLGEVGRESHDDVIGFICGQIVEVRAHGVGEGADALIERGLKAVHHFSPIVRDAAPAGVSRPFIAVANSAQLAVCASSDFTPCGLMA